MSALHGLDQYRGQIVGVLTNPFQRLRRAIIQHDHIRHALARNTGRDWHGLWLTGPVSKALRKNLIKHAMVVARKHDDLIAPGYRARRTHRGKNGLGAGVAECHALVAGHLAEHFCDLACKWRLGADFETFLKLRFDGLGDELGAMAQHDLPKAIDEIDILVAVDIPDPRPFRAVGNDRIDHLLPLLPES